MTAWILAMAVAAHPGAVPLQYDAALAEKGFPSPVVRIGVPGQPPALLLVDTGASIHTLAAWFVESAHIDAQAAEGTARGSTGNVSSIRVARDVPLKLENGDALPLTEAIVVDFPPMFGQLRIAGLLSPQLLAPPGQAAVLDLATPSMTIAPVASAPHTGRVCINRESEFRNLSYSVPITILGQHGAMILDTGATSTLIAAGSSIGKALADRSVEGKHTQGLGGEAEATRHVPGVTIRRGGSPTIADVNLGKSPGPACGPDGLLGMDALRGCVLVLGESSASIRC
jgi:hypothetical protein